MSIDSLTTAARAAGYAMAASEELLGDQPPAQPLDTPALRQDEDPAHEPPPVRGRSVKVRPQPISDWLAFWRVPA